MDGHADCGDSPAGIPGNSTSIGISTNYNNYYNYKDNSNTYNWTISKLAVTSLSPLAGPVGTAVTIMGNGFGASQSSSTVSFNGIAGIATSWIDTQLIVPVPSGATTGNLIVTVSGVASSGVNFTVLVPPSVESISPTLGPIGTVVTIKGMNFGPTQGTSTVGFNGTVATPTSWSDTQIVVPVPVGATPGNLVVTVAGVASSAVSFTVGTEGYSYARAVIINHLQILHTDQTDFPALISGVFPYLATVANGGHVQNANGYDIVFTSDAAGQQKLDHEIDSYDPVTGTAALWVRIPLLSHTTDTTIYMWYGNSAVVVSQENKSGVWQNGYAAVWHFGSGGILGTSDSTGNGNNAVNYGVAASTTGVLGGAGSFNDTYLRVPSSVSLHPTAALSLEAWVWPNSDREWYSSILSISNNSSSSYPCELYSSCSYYMMPAGGANPTPLFGVNQSFNGNSAGSQIPGSQWSHVVDTYDGSNAIVYTNGVLTNSSATTGAIGYGGYDLYISNPSYGWKGQLDEVRISSVARSSDWIAIEYNNQTSTATDYSQVADSTFLFICPEQSSGNTITSCVQPVSVDSYSYIRPITIDHRQVVRSDQTDFPVLISGVLPYLATVANGGHVQQSHGYDIVFTSDSAGQQKLDHEIDSYDPVTGTVAFWVRIPLLSHTTDTMIYMWYGNSAVIVSPENRAGVWKNGYAAVWHFGSEGILSTNDSTGNGNNAINYGIAASVTGVIGGAASANKTYLRVPSNASFEPAVAVTLEAWVNPNAINQYDSGIISFSDTSNYPCEDSSRPCSYYMDTIGNANPTPVFGINQSLGSYTSGSPIKSGQWTHLVDTYDGNHAIVYADGIPSGSSAATGAINYQVGNDLYIGSLNYGWTGQLDEVRISTISRSADWIATEYSNESNASGFLMICPEQSSGNPIESCDQMVPIAGFSYIRPVVIDHRKVIRTDQTDFPVLVSGTFPYLATTANGGHVQNANGYDIVFTSDAAGQQKLDHEIDSYDPVTGTAAFWVRIPLLSHSTDTTIYMWYGNSAVSVSQENKTGVWQNGYAAVWHFGSGGILNTNDSTGNGNSAINYGIVASATGAIGGAATANKTYLRIPSNASFQPSSAVTLEAWANPNAASTYNQSGIISFSNTSTYLCEDNWTSCSYFMDTVGTGNQTPIFGVNQSIPPNGYTSGSAIPANQWTHIVGAYDGNNTIVYANGVPTGSSVTTGTISYRAGDDLYIGSSNYGWTGQLDEIRISTVARSSDWIGTEYNSQSSPRTFAIPSSEIPSSTPIISSIVPGTASAGTSVVITGGGFGQSQGAASVAFNGIIAIPTSWSNWQVIVTVPTGATTGNVVLTANGSASAGTAFVVPVVINSTTPSTGPAGTIVTLVGSGFGISQNASTVTFNGIVATPNSWSDTQIVVPVPSGASTGNLLVNVSGIPSNGVAFSVPAGISGASPNSGSAGTVVTLTGFGFGANQNTSVVEFNGVIAVPSSWSDTQITVPVPSGATTGNVVMVSGGVPSNGVAFTVPVTINSVSPSAGLAQTPITVVGTGFGATQSMSTVTFNGTLAVPSSWSDTQVVVPVPTGSTSGNVVVTVAGIASNAVAFTVSTGAYSYARALIINHSQILHTDQTDFPVLISGVFPYLATVANGGHVQNANGYDIVFTSDAAGQQKLDYEIDSYDPVTGTAAFWVRIPLLSHSTDTTLYMWYGNSAAPVSLENKAGVWRNGYAAVYHFGGSSLSTLDSTGNQNNALNYGAVFAAGEFGGAGSFDSVSQGWGGSGGDSYLQIPSGASLQPTTALTLESWVKPSINFGNSNIISLESGSTQAYTLMLYSPEIAVTVSGKKSAVTTSNMEPLNQWMHMVGTYDGSNLMVYINGVPRASLAQSGPIDYGASTDLKVGSLSQYLGFRGLIDEVRISTVARSADWIAIEYNNQTSAPTDYNKSTDSTFLLVCPEQNSGSSVASCIQPVSVTSFSYIRPLTINHRQIVRSDQTDFPLLVSGVFPYLATVANGGHVQNANGYDIVFTSDAAGQQKLDHEIDSYDPATGTAAFWVRIPLLSHTADTTIYMWYGNSAVQVSLENKSGVWQNGYAAVYHFGGRSLSSTDSTANQNNAVNYGVLIAQGEFGGAGNFNSSLQDWGLYTDAFLQIPLSNSFQPTTALTLEAWVSQGGAYSNTNVISLESGNTQAYTLKSSSYNPYIPELDITVNGQKSALVSSVTAQQGRWTHIAGTYDGTKMMMYANGLSAGSFPLSGLIDYAASTDLKIGSLWTGSGYRGLIDEVRISTVARSGDWIATEYNNGTLAAADYNNGTDSTFLLVCPEQNSGSSVAPCILPVSISSFSYIRPLTIDHRQVVRSDQTDFPVLISGVFPYLATVGNGGRVQNANGYDIVFTSDSAGLQKLDHEIDSYDPVTGIAAFWVRIPLLSHTTDTPIYMWYGNSSVFVSLENRAGVWRNGYAAVYHLGGSSLITSDSTSHQNDTENYGVTSAEGEFGGAANVNGRTYLLAPSNDSFKSGATVALEAWVKPNGSTDRCNFISLNGSTTQTYVLKFAGDQGNVPELDVTVAGSQFSVASSVAVPEGQWTHLVGSYDGSNMILYANGVPVGSVPLSGAIDYGTSSDLLVGSPFNRWNSGFPGIIDEARVSMMARSADWIATEYNNQGTPEDFIASCAEQAVGSDISTCTTSVPATKYSYFRPITIAHQNVIRSDQTDFPVLLAGTFPFLVSVANGGHVQNANGYDIAFTQDAAGQVPLDYEIDGYNPTTGQAAFWIRMPTLSHSVDTTIYMWYGNNAVEMSQENKSGVWANGYVGVWHLAGNSSDSTANSVHGVDSNISYGANVGRTGIGAAFTGNSIINFGSSPTYNLSDNFSMSVWAKPGATGNYQGIFNKAQKNPGAGFGISELSDNTLNFSMFQSDNSAAAAKSDSPVTLGNWAHLEAVRRNSAAYLYVNGVEQPTIALQTPNLNSSDPLLLGQAFSNVGGSTFNGVMNDATISNVARSADWIATEYINQSAPASFATVCAEQTAGTSALPCASTTTSYPVINGARPTSGGAGTAVTVSGTGFGQTQNGSTLSFNGIPAAMTSWSDTQIIATVPVNATTGPLVALIGGVRSNSDVTFSVPNPTIGSVTPNSGPVGTQISISGIGFGATQGGSALVLGGTVPSVSSWSDTQIIATVPVSVGGTQVLQVAVGGVNSNANVAFTVPAPVIGNVTPSSGPVGTQVVVTGTGFVATQRDSILTLGGTSLQVSSWSDTQIVANIPTTLGGTQSFRAVVNGSASNTNIAFTVPAPHVTSIAPSKGDAGTQVTINGAYFTPVQGQVALNGVSASVVSWTDTQIVAVVQSGSASSQPAPVTVCANGAWSNSDVLFTFTLPVVTGISPNSGSVGTTLTVSGTGFGSLQGSSVVSVNGATAAVSNWSDTRIIAVVQTGAKTGPVAVSVGGNVSSNGNIVFSMPNPVVSSVSPGTGAASSQVNIIGSGFGAIQGGSFATFGGIVAPIVTWGDSQITVIAPPSAAATSAVPVQVIVGGVPSNANIHFTFSSPHVAAVNPTSGIVGAAIAVTGSGFGAGGGNLYVNGVGANVSSWSDSKIIATVPSGATTGPVTVAIGNVGSNNNVFFTMPNPKISGISPGTGEVESSVTISGTGFGTSQGSSSVTFNNVAAVVGSWSDTNIIVSAPLTAASKSPVAIRVTVGGVVVSSDTNFNYLAPLVSSITPTSGSVGTVVTINGTGFGSGAGNSYVAFNGTYGTSVVTRWTSTQIVLTSPSKATSGPVVVWLNGSGGLPSNSDVVFTMPNPVIYNAAPPIGPLGTTVVLNGAGFGSGNCSNNSATTSLRKASPRSVQANDQTGSTCSNGSILYLGGFPISPSTWNDTAISFVVPSAVAAPQPIMVTVGGVSSNSNVTFTTPYPQITGISPTIGAPGTQVTFTGTSFGSAQVGNTVTFNGNAASIVSWSDTSIVASVPNNTTSGPVVVNELLGQTLAASNNNIVFTIPNPVVNNISPVNGMPGTLVTVNGSGFGATQGANTVAFNGVNATVTSWSDTQIVATVASGTKTGTVVVRGPTGLSNSSVVFTIPTPTVSSVTPVSGSVGSQITLAGGLFGATQSGSVVTVNGTYATVTSWSDSQIVATVPNWSATGAVVVSGPTGISNTDVTFTIPAPVISSITPASGPSGTLVKIIGTSFGAYSNMIQFNGNSASIVNWSDTEVDAYVPAAAASPLSLPVQAYVSRIWSNRDVTFTTTAPQISGISPTNGVVGTSVTITGSGFGRSDDPGTLTFNGIRASATQWSDTQIVASVPSGAKTGPVLVTIGGSGGLMSNNDQVFTMPNPVLSALTPDTGLRGTQVTVTGTGFGASQGSSGISFNGAVTTPSSWSDTQIVTTVPATAITGPVVVTVGGVSSNGLTYTVPFPNVASINPTVGPIGTSVTITGTNFGTTTGTITFNDSPATVTSWSNTQIVATVPSTAISGPVVVNLGGLASNSDQIFTIPPPVIASVSPTSGVVGTQVTVTGTGFNTATGYLKFNGAAATILSWTPTSIVATVAKGARSGSVVATVNGIDSNSDQTFAMPNPVVTSLSPITGSVTTQVTISGTGFGASQADSTVNFNHASPAPVVSWSDTQIVVTLPERARTGGVTVTVGGVDSNSDQTFTVPVPQITGIDPTSGIPGTEVTISGTGFDEIQDTSVVTFNGVTASVSGWTDTQVIVSVPGSAKSGPINVQVKGNTVQSATFTVDTAQTLITNSLGSSTSYQTGAWGGMLKVFSATGPGCSSCTYRNNLYKTYDDSGNVLTSTDAAGHVTTYTYDDNNNMLSVSVQLDDGTAVTTSYTYNSLGQPLTVTDAMGNTTTNTYDAQGNLLSVSTPSPDGSSAGSSTNFQYNSAGELTQITDPLGRATSMTHTYEGLVATITDPQQNVTTYQYDAHGNRTSVKDALGNTTTFAYDSGDRLTLITYSDKTTASFTYDYRGRRASATDQNGLVTSYTYDDADRLISTTDAASNTTQYAYDTEDNLLNITDASGHTTGFTYDAYGRVMQTNFPSSLSESYTYDAIGNLLSKTDRNTKTITYLYDALSRLTHKGYPDSTGVDYTYDLVGKVLSVNDPTGSYGFSYDNMGRLIGTSTSYAFLSGQPYTNSYTYDAASNRIGSTLADGTTNTYQYDTLNRLTSLANPWAGTLSMSYDTLSRRTQLSRPNNVSTNYQYDSLSRLLSVLHTGANDGATYVYDSAGNRTSKQNLMTGTTEAYSYDPIYQLTQVLKGATQTENYSYDAVGNRLSALGVSPWTYNSSNQLLNTTTTTYTYDKNGNMMSKTLPSGATTYTWDFENRLLSTTTPAANNTTSTVTFKYDPFGRRIQKAASSGITNYVYDGANIIAELDALGAVVASYTQGTGIDEPLAMRRGGYTGYYHADGLGSITSLTSSTGKTVATYAYDSFGNTTATEGIFNPFRYTAREQDPETGLYYYRARYYDPTIGRFLSEDPIGFNGGGNFYRYAVNNPINLSDPMGWNPIAIPIEVGICLASGACEGAIIVAGGVIVGGAIIYGGYVYFSKPRGHSDPIPWPGEPNPGQCKDNKGKCNPCPPDSPYWDQPGNAHGGTGGVHYHWWHFNQKPYPDCTCMPSRLDGGTPPIGGTPWNQGGPTWP